MLFKPSQKHIINFILYILYIRKGMIFMNNFSIDFIIGGCDILFKTLLVFIIIDYITGILRAIYTKKLSSKIGAKGIIKKVGYIFIVILAALLDKLLNSTGNIRNIVIYMFIANEGISILENWTSMGIKIPKILKDKFNDINKDIDDKNK